MAIEVYAANFTVLSNEILALNSKIEDGTKKTSHVDLHKNISQRHEIFLVFF